MADNRYRNWATILYPDSAKENWEEILSDLKTPICISPLHDQDVNPGGEKKKPHYHILFTFEGKKSREQIKEITDSIGAVGQETVQSIRGYARYLCHKDNPEKYQYSESGIRSIGGFDYDEVIGLRSDRYKVFEEIEDYIVENDIRSFARLVLYARQNRQDWHRILCDSGTIFLTAFIKSYHWETQLHGIEQKRTENSKEPYNCST